MHKIWHTRGEASRLNAEPSPAESPGVRHSLAQRNAVVQQRYTDFNSKLRGDAFAKPQAICRTYWTVEAFKMDKISTALN